MSAHSLASNPLVGRFASHLTEDVVSRLALGGEPLDSRILGLRSVDSLGPGLGGTGAPMFGKLEVDVRAVLPQPLQAVEHPLLLVEDVHDEVTEVDEEGRHDDLPSLRNELEVKKKHVEEAGLADVEARAQRLESELAQPEAEGAEASQRDKLRKTAEREITAMRRRNQRALEHMDKVWDRFVSLKVGDLEGDEVLYVARSATPQRLISVDLSVGSRLPAYCTSMGRILLAALDDAIADDKKYGNGAEQIARWARSRDGREVLSCAGIDPNERVVKGLVEFVSKGVRTSVALSREESERRLAAEADEAEAA